MKYPAQFQRENLGIIYKIDNNNNNTLIRHVRKFHAQFTLNGTFLRKDSFHNSCKCPKFMG